VPELEFGDIQRQIFAADLVIDADNTALQDAPKALNRIGVYRADNVIAAALADNLLRVGTKEAIAGVFIGREQADLVRHGLIHEGVKRLGVRVVDHAQDNVALAADHG
jgi:hypothetical protein